MLSISLKNFLLIWQFLLKYDIELPGSITCSYSGGSWKKETKSIRFRASNEYRVEIFTQYIVFLGFRIAKAFGQAEFERLPLDAKIDPEDSDFCYTMGKRWRSITLFGFILLTRIAKKK